MVAMDREHWNRDIQIGVHVVDTFDSIDIVDIGINNESNKDI